MTAQGKIKDGDKVTAPTGLDLLRAPFPANQISKLPKPTKRQTEALRAAQDRKDFSLGVKCKLCGQWHHKDTVHLDYVGHAALTDRLLDCDPEWNWEPVATTETGAPMTDENGGMWIRLTVCGVTRLGYGHPDGKRGGDALKETIGDALRNAAMRFGAALDLWHKGDLHAIEDADESKPDEGGNAPPPQNDAPTPRQIADRIITDVNKAKGNKGALTALWGQHKAAMAELPDDLFAEAKAAFAAAAPKDPPNADLGGDEIPF